MAQFGCVKCQSRDPSPGSLATGTVLTVTATLGNQAGVLLEGDHSDGGPLEIAKSRQGSNLWCYLTAHTGAPRPSFPRVVLTQYHELGDLK